MGKFDGYLICSDFDGTIYMDQQISQKNIDAIKSIFEESGIKNTAVISQRALGNGAPAGDRSELYLYQLAAYQAVLICSRIHSAYYISSVLVFYGIIIEQVSNRFDPCC